MTHSKPLALPVRIGWTIATLAAFAWLVFEFVTY